MEPKSNETDGQAVPPAPVQPMSLPPPPKQAMARSPRAGQPQPPPADMSAAENSLAQSLVASIVDDGDLIEKEWVVKAKQIVLANRNDPHRQSEEMMIFRANYMKKRFGKDIKLSK